MAETTLTVDGMACDGCEQNVTEALEGVGGIDAVDADHESDEVRVEHDPGAVDEGTIRSTIAEAGYDPV